MFAIIPPPRHGNRQNNMLEDLVPLVLSSKQKKNVGTFHTRFHTKFRQFPEVYMCLPGGITRPIGLRSLHTSDHMVQRGSDRSPYKSLVIKYTFFARVYNLAAVTSSAQQRSV